MINALIAWWDSKTAIAASRMRSLFAFAWGFGTVEHPSLRNWQLDIGSLRTLRRDGITTHPVIDWNSEPLYWNGVLFMRLTWPFGGFWQLRWGGAQANPALWQGGLGYDFNGRLRLIFRIQSDASARAGVSVPNLWEVTGWNYGGH